MEKDITYKLEQKDTRGFLPRCLTQWKIIANDLDLDEVKKYLVESRHNRLLRLKQTGKETILEYEQTPDWSSEDWENFKGRHLHEVFYEGSASEYVLHRITPPLQISFAKRD